MKVPIDKLSIYDIEPCYGKKDFYTIELIHFNKNRTQCSMRIELKTDDEINIPIESVKLIEALDINDKPCEIDNFDEVASNLHSIIKSFSEKNSV